MSATGHGYSRYTNGCRCDVCRLAKADYQRTRRAQAAGRPPNPPRASEMLLRAKVDARDAALEALAHRHPEEYAALYSAALTEELAGGAR